MLKSLYCAKSSKVIFIVVSWTVGAIGGLSVKDDKKVTEISFYRTMRRLQEYRLSGR